MKYKLESSGDNGIYYYLGNITGHISHILPLYDKLGGTVVVSSRKARDSLLRYHDTIRIINIDNKPYKLLRPGWRPKLIHEHTLLDKSLKETYDYLNTHAKVVLFYDLFDIQRLDWLNKPKKVFLHHGNGLKPFFEMQPKRLKILDQYDFIASLGPYLKKKLLGYGVPRNKLLDIGIARTDSILSTIKDSRNIRSQLVSLLKLDQSKKIILYSPTFWGDSSVYDIGLEIVKNISDEYTLLLRLHPQTPSKLIRQYSSLIEGRSNVKIISDSTHPNVSIPQMLAVSDVIILDFSSVVTEALLADRPFIFAISQSSEVKGMRQEYESIKEIFTFSEKVSVDSVYDINHIIRSAIKKGVDSSAWSKVKSRIWFHANGTATASIKQEILRITNDES